jgi:hypothetical protein
MARDNVRVPYPEQIEMRGYEEIENYLTLNQTIGDPENEIEWLLKPRYL